MTQDPDRKFSFELYNGAMSTTGPKTTSTLKGTLRFEQGENRIVMDNDDGNPGLKLIIGRMPDGTVNIAIAKDGENVLDAFED